MAFDDVDVPKSKLEMNIDLNEPTYYKWDKNTKNVSTMDKQPVGLLMTEQLFDILNEKKLAGESIDLTSFGFPQKPDGYVSVDEIKKIIETSVEPYPTGVLNELDNSTVTLQGKDSLEGGRKFDYGKTLYSLVPPHFIKEFADVLTLGARKYSAENWKKVPDARVRYKDAMLRHIYSYLQGDIKDDETGLHHLAHATCCIAFLYELERLDLNP